MKIRIMLCVVATAAMAGQAAGQSAPATAAATPVAVPTPLAGDAAVAPTRGVTENTPVVIEVGAPLNSKTSKIGDTFPIRLASPLLDGNGRILIPSGTLGGGEVIHAAKARGLGKAGEMILAARYLQCGDTRIPLGHFKFAMRGKDNSTNAAIAVAVAGPLLAFMSGGEVNIPNGARADAKITARVAISEQVTAQCGGTPPPQSTTVTTSTTTIATGKGSQ